MARRKHSPVGQKAANRDVERVFYDAVETSANRALRLERKTLLVTDMLRQGSRLDADQRPVSQRRASITKSSGPAA